MKFGCLISSLVLTLSLTACGSSSDEETPDAPTDGPGTLPRAQEVNCTTAVTKEITTSETMLGFTPPAMTVTKGTIVRFKNASPHDTKSRDNLFLIEIGQTECVKFNEVGTYTFDCRPHSFAGTVTVQ